MKKVSIDDFHVNLDQRIVIHKPSGISVSFYEYTSESDWERSDSATLRDNPAWTGDRMELARMAKAAALAKGMKAAKPPPWPKVHYRPAGQPTKLVGRIRPFKPLCQPRVTVEWELDGVPVKLAWYYDDVTGILVESEEALQKIKSRADFEPI